MSNFTVALPILGARKKQPGNKSGNQTLPQPDFIGQKSRLFHLKCDLN